MSVNSVSVFRNGLLVVFIPYLLMGCARGSNFFSELSDKTTDQAIYYDANHYLESGEWTNAIGAVAKLTTTYQAKRDVQVLLASAYAGRCGLDLLLLADKFQKSTTSNTSLFSILFTAFNGAGASQVNDCITAENTLKTLWGSTTPSSANPIKENVLMMFIGFAKIGAILNFRGDLNKDNAIDWTRTAGTNYPCENTGGGAIALPAADLNEIVTGFALAIGSLAAAGTSSAGSLTTIAALCTGSGALVATGICAAYSTATVTAPYRFFMRALIEDSTNNIGLKIFAHDFTNPVSLVLSCPNAT